MKNTTECARFNRTMRDLMKVPHSEIQAPGAPSFAHFAKGEHIGAFPLNVS
jgi:hypothetical protein